jgi:hypothetical protein
MFYQPLSLDFSSSEDGFSAYKKPFASEILRKAYIGVQCSLTQELDIWILVSLLAARTMSVDEQLHEPYPDERVLHDQLRT